MIQNLSENELHQLTTFDLATASIADKNEIAMLFKSKSVKNIAVYAENLKTFYFVIFTNSGVMLTYASSRPRRPKVFKTFDYILKEVTEVSDKSDSPQLLSIYFKEGVHT